MTGPQAVQAAAEGRLEVEPFTMPVNTAYGLVRAEGERRRSRYSDELVERSPQEAVEYIRRFLLQAVHGQAERMVIEAERDGELDVDSMIGIARCLKVLQRGTGRGEAQSRATPPRRTVTRQRTLRSSCSNSTAQHGTAPGTTSRTSRRRFRTSRHFSRGCPDTRRVRQRRQGGVRRASARTHETRNARARGLTEGPACSSHFVSRRR
jgi:hypothetical protein